MALRGINAALNDPIQASTETTLAAILCLSLYEVSLGLIPGSYLRTANLIHIDHCL
jgi:hypothetical protein